MPWKGFLETVVPSELEGGPSLKEEGGVVQLDVDASGVPALSQGIASGTRASVAVEIQSRRARMPE
jgi:hypothetical protein